MKKPLQVRDLTGQSFGFLTVISFAGTNKFRMAMWLCRCVCGTEKEIMRGSLVSGNTKSCGCKWAEAHTKHGHTSRAMGRETRAYRTWSSMKGRCSNPMHCEYSNYGARGIKVCDRWLESFENFLADMGDKPKGMSLDRVDNDGNYCKENCRWISMAEQQQNKRTTVRVTINGITKCAAEWARIAGINPRSLGSRLKHGWSGEKLLLPTKKINAKPASPTSMV